MNPQDKLKLALAPEDESPFTLWLTLGTTVSVESRVVTSLPALFGEIVGLRDFFNFIIVLAIGSSQAKMFKFDMLTTFFRYEPFNQVKHPNESKMQARQTGSIQMDRNQFKRFDFSIFD